MRSSHLITEVTSSQEMTLQTHPWKSPRDIVGWLHRKGFQLKGRGKFGAVFSKPGYDRLVKISFRADECWLRFAQWVVGMKTNASLPHIDWVRTYTAPYTGPIYGKKSKSDEAGKEVVFFVSVIERLAPFNKNAIMNTVDLPGLAYLYVYDEWFGDPTNGDPNIQYIEDRFWKEKILTDNDLNRHGEVDMKKAQKTIARYLKRSSGGRTFINTLIAAKKKAFGSCTFDMHSGNLMYRPSDQRLVITDPLGDLTKYGY